LDWFWKRAFGFAYPAFSPAAGCVIVYGDALAAGAVGAVHWVVWVAWLM